MFDYLAFMFCLEGFLRVMLCNSARLMCKEGFCEFLHELWEQPYRCPLINVLESSFILKLSNTFEMED